MLSRTISFLLIALIPLYILAVATWFPQYSTLFLQRIISGLQATTGLLPTYTRTWSFSRAIPTNEAPRTTNKMPFLSFVARPNQEVRRSSCHSTSTQLIRDSLFSEGTLTTVGSRPFTPSRSPRESPIRTIAMFTLTEGHGDLGITITDMTSLDAFGSSMKIGSLPRTGSARTVIESSRSSRMSCLGNLRSTSPRSLLSALPPTRLRST